MTDPLALDVADDDVLWLVEESSVQMRGHPTVRYQSIVGTSAEWTESRPSLPTEDAGPAGWTLQ